MRGLLPSALQQRWANWWEARLPRRDQIRLTQRNIYILPSRAGLSFALVVVVLLLASINEQINLGYALAFLLCGAGMAALYQTHGNLQGVDLRLVALHSVHAGQVLRLPVTLGNPHRRLGRFNVQISVDVRGMVGLSGPLVHVGEGASAPQHVDLLPGSENSVEVDVPTSQRGWLSVPRLTIETRYPLGLFRAWAYWRPQSKVLIWPALDPNAPPLPALPGQDSAEAHARALALEADMPEGLRDHRRGDPLRWVAWKKSTRALANGGQLVSREPAGGRSPDRWLDYDLSPSLHSLGAEARLSRLASWLLQAEADLSSHGPAYGLRLPGLTLSCGGGAHHLRQCLDALAAWAPPGATMARGDRKPSTREAH
jgi:uncharacterized protein (DUF58 family)